MRAIRMDRPTLAVTVTAAVVVALLVAINIQRIPFVHPTDTYSADFSSAGGLAPGNEVRVGGVRVGEVEGVELAGQHVRVAFSVDKGLRLGDQSRASIEIATVLGNVFLQVESAGTGRLRSRTAIPVDRTTVPFTLLDALGTVAQKTGELDAASVQRALNEVAATMGGISKPDVDATVKGLTKLSNALAARQGEIAALVDGARRITESLASKSNDLVALLGQSDIFLRTLNYRQQAIEQLLIHARSLGRQVSTLIQEQGAPLASSLDRINALTTDFAADSDTLKRSIDLIGKFSVNIANATGNGTWIDVYLPTGLIPDNVIGACGTNPKPGCAG